VKTIKPPRLKPGDSVGLISPSNSLVPRAEAFKAAVKRFEEALEVRLEIAPHALGTYWYSSGTVDERLADFHQMVMDPTIKAIVFTVGGNTAIELVDKLDYALIAENPKVITGISDATTLLTAITAKTGLITFLGSEFTDFGLEPMEFEIGWMKKAWFEGRMGEIKPNPKWRDFDGLPTSYAGWQTIRPGKTKGRLVGGNFSSFFQLLHTPYAPELNDSILLFETYKWPKRAIHQGIVLLRLHGLLDRIGGMIVGYCLGSDDAGEVGNKRAMKDLVLEATEGYDFPVMQVGEIGHNVENVIVPIGAEAFMDAENLIWRIEEDVVD
jgi:muramoyltetrapeptide carboxypeptidase